MTKTLIPEHTLSDLDILAKIKAGTHVIVPVEPTEAMLSAFAASCDDYGQCLAKTGYRAMIKAAQEV